MVRFAEIALHELQTSIFCTIVYTNTWIDEIFFTLRYRSAAQLDWFVQCNVSGCGTLPPSDRNYFAVVAS